MSRVIGVIARVFLWRLGCSKPRVLVERSHKTLIVEVLWIKPQLGENNHGIITFMWFYKELEDLR